jgi:F0F1-type ATP synthase assembly protein I
VGPHQYGPRGFEGRWANRTFFGFAVPKTCQAAHAKTRIRGPRRPAKLRCLRGRVDSSAWARGFRLSSEFVAAVLVGAGLGFLVDHYLRVSPGGLIVFTLLGFAVGVLNLMRANTPRAPDSPTQRRPD